MLSRNILALIFVLTVVSPVPAQSSSLFLKLGVTPEVQSISSSNTVTARNGRVFSLDNISPYSKLFSSRSFVSGNNGKSVTNKDTNEVIDVFVYKRVDTDGTQVMVTKNQDNEVKYIQVRDPNERNGKATHFIADESTLGSFFCIDDDDYDYVALTNLISFGDDSLSPARREKAYSDGNTHGGSGGQRRRDTAFSFSAGDGTSAECKIFKLIPVAIVFDEEFCQLYNGQITNAVAAIQSIVATASVFYENDLCARLSITGISTDSCITSESVYASLDKSTCNNLLSNFSEYMFNNRDMIGISRGSIVHMFTGHQLDGTLGCSWLPAVCDPEYGTFILKSVNNDLACDVILTTC